ncbi:MAG: ThuA domain-containing protein [Planctomycetaceae bacterium]
MPVLLVRWRMLLLAGLLAGVAMLPGPAETAEPASPFELRLRSQIETSPGSGRYHTTLADEVWQPGGMAIIVCDMWDSHHSEEAVKRVNEIAPRLDALLRLARERGVTIIHAPSDCLDYYQDHPARLRAMRTPKVADLPPEITKWCYQIPAEEQGTYPIDQSDGGEDDEPEAHQRWLAKLAAEGLNPRAPWTRQIDVIEIDPEQDYITALGDEVWSILAERGIDNVLVAGVHTNMCVLGRPFGLRRLASNGKHVALIRDLTDTMYNPKSAPFVSHFTGTDLIVSHIERHVCATVTSDQLLGDERPFRFSADRRPHLAMVIAEAEYDTAETLPKFAIEHLGHDYRVSYVYANDADRNDLPGLEVLDDADIALISARRRVLPAEQLAHVRKFVAAGKPLIGIRTSSHAFCLRNEPPPAGLTDWPELDAQVWGGSYTNHYANDAGSTVTTAATGVAHEILKGLPGSFPQHGSLYKTAPLADGAMLLLEGRLNNGSAIPEPVAWTFRRADGGVSFYTSLGHKGDFAAEEFPRLLKQAIDWAVKVESQGTAAVE